MSFFSKFWGYLKTFFSATPVVLDDAAQVAAIVGTVVPQARVVAAGLAVADQVVHVIVPLTVSNGAAVALAAPAVVKAL